MQDSPSPNTDAIFPCHPPGYIRHWLVTGPREIPYEGPRADENTLRREALDPSRTIPPSSASLHAEGPFGDPWRFHYPGENFFVEHSKFYHGLTVIDSCAFAEIESAGDSRREAHLWVSGSADLWVNDIPVTRFNVTRYMYPDFQMVTLPLREGINRICVRLQCFGVRDTCNLFGLQLRDPSGISVRLPGCGRLAEAAVWLDGVQTRGRDAIISTVPAPVEASISIAGCAPVPWPAGCSSLSLGAKPFQFSVRVAVNGEPLQRSLEIPANRAGTSGETGRDIRQRRLEFIGGLAKREAGLPLRKEFLPLLARRIAGRKSAGDAAALDATLAFIDSRGDCADFALATLLRMEALGLADAAESAKIRRTALAFRYWTDEPGSDAMCFWSENHSLLFHGCQLIAGRLYPKETFSNSNRTGKEQAKSGIARCRAWLDRIEPRGLEEFNSGTYLPITVGALLNVVDFSNDMEMAGRASRLLDRLYEDLALHAFQGVVISPQGRVYRNVLYPQESGTQALLSDAIRKAPPDFPAFSDRSPSESWTGDWLVYPVSSRSYRPPVDLEALMEEPASKQYRRGFAEILLHKTSAYLLTSLAVPPPADTVGETNGAHFQPGMAGYQQHLWQATLGRDCHVFVNHPGASFDESKSRPGYWYGNGVLPRLRQREGVLQAIFDIPDGSNAYRERTLEEWLMPQFRGSRRPFDLHPIPFTHVHWPSDAFDRQEIRDHWLFGCKGAGGIAVWCSEPLTPHHEMLTGREFRAWAWRSAWVAICGDMPERGGFEAFVGACVSRQPVFDSAAPSLQMAGEEPLLWSSP